MGKEEPFYFEQEQVLTINDWMKSNHNLVAGFSTRRGGVSSNDYDSLNVGFHVDDDPNDVAENRQVIASLVQFPLERWVVGEQVHRADIQKVTKAEQGCGAYSHDTSLRGIDGLYTTERDLLLVSLYADCVPLFFYVPSKQLIGLAHAGWRGTAANIAQKMIEALVSNENVSCDEIEVVIGPSISAKHYEVTLEVVEEIAKQLPSLTDSIAVKCRDNQYKLNLKEANKQLLLAAGIPKQQIKVTNYCTAESESLFFSYRRDRGVTGRMMSFIGLKSKADTD